VLYLDRVADAGAGAQPQHDRQARHRRRLLERAFEDVRRPRLMLTQLRQLDAIGGIVAAPVVLRGELHERLEDPQPVVRLARRVLILVAHQSHAERGYAGNAAVAVLGDHHVEIEAVVRARRRCALAKFGACPVCGDQRGE
jgi:hypothetical protein